MNIRIVADSSADITQLEGVSFGYAPMKIITSEKEYIDTENLDVTEMVTELEAYKGRSFTSCPNTNDWIEAFGDAEYIICVTITSTLSGSYNSAMLAKQTYEEDHPGRRVFVLDTLSAGPEISLAVIKAAEIADKYSDFDDLCKAITEYTANTGLLFSLESLTNFANNGRVSPIVAKMVGILGIRLVGKASDKGDLEPLAKCRGEAKALREIVSQLRNAGLSKGRVRIHHTLNENAAEALRGLILDACPEASVEIFPNRGLCSFYAQLGGLLVGFEKR